MLAYEEYVRGNLVDVVDTDGAVLVTGTIIRTGSRHASVTTEEGETHDVPYSMIRPAGLSKQAAKEVLKEEERDGRKFSLVREEENKDGQLSVKFKVFLNDKPISESEELITNVYDAENGWSAPDDFDENKMDLIKSTYESGFSLIVDSYDNIAQAVSESTALPEGGEQPVEPQGKPAFAPGTGPAADTGTGAAPDMGAGAPAAGPEEPEEPAEATEAEEEGNGTVGPEPHAAPAGEAPAAPVEAVGASLARRSFARSVISARADEDRVEAGIDRLTTEIQRLGGGLIERSAVTNGYITLFKSGHKIWEGPKEQAGAHLTATANAIKRMTLGSQKYANELLRNPQHRINPVLRAEMDRRHIDSAETNDLELAEDLKDFDFGTPAPKN